MWRCELDSFGSGQEQVAGCWQHGDEPSGSINNGWFMDELRNRSPRKEFVHRVRRWWNRPVDSRHKSALSVCLSLQLPRVSAAPYRGVHAWDAARITCCVTWKRCMTCRFEPVQFPARVAPLKVKWMCSHGTSAGNSSLCAGILLRR